MLVHDELTKDPFLGYPYKPRKEEVDLRLGLLEKPLGDGDVDLSEQQQSIRTFSLVGGSFHLHGVGP